MKTENVVHHYINAYVNQVERIKENRQVTELTKYQNAKEYREQEYRTRQNVRCKCIAKHGNIKHVER